MGSVLPRSSKKEERKKKVVFCILFFERLLQTKDQRRLEDCVFSISFILEYSPGGRQTFRAEQMFLLPSSPRCRVRSDSVSTSATQGSSSKMLLRQRLTQLLTCVEDMSSDEEASEEMSRTLDEAFQLCGRFLPTDAFRWTHRGGEHTLIYKHTGYAWAHTHLYKHIDRQTAYLQINTITCSGGSLYERVTYKHTYIQTYWLCMDTHLYKHIDNLYIYTQTRLHVHVRVTYTHIHTYTHGRQFGLKCAGDAFGSAFSEVLGTMRIHYSFSL